MAYTTESYKEPFWAKSGDFIRGRDPLGIQNSSISTYATLLPGMTNLTLRLRYYGFYLWLLQEYTLLNKGDIFHSSSSNQYNFIRRGELALAFYMSVEHFSEGAVVGINFAVNNRDNTIDDFYNISLGADKNKDTVKDSVYWDYRSGAFGQYYVGSLVNLGLVSSIKDGYFTFSDKGKELANSYKQTIGTQASDFLVQVITSGKLYKNSLNNLQPFALNYDVSNTGEWNFYKQILLGADKSNSKNISESTSSIRKQSIKLFLEQLSHETNYSNWLDFPKHQYGVFHASKGDNVIDATKGWYYYYLNEQVHYALESIFWAMLTQMESKEYQINEFVNLLSSDTEKHTNSNFGIETKHSILEITENLEDVFNTAFTYVDEIKKEVKNKNVVDVLSNSFVLLLSLYKTNKDYFAQVEEFSVSHNLNDKRGNAIDVFQNLVIKKSNINFNEFVKFILRYILNDHSFVAYGKMGNGERNLLKFIVEDNYLVWIETMSPNFTNPRLQALYNFVRDLKLIDVEGRINENGLEFLESIKD